MNKPPIMRLRKIPPDWYLTAWIRFCNWIVAAICKHIAGDRISSVGAGEGVSVDKAVDDGVVVAALEVIPSRFWLMLVAATPELERV